MFLRAADLLAGPWRDVLNGATVLGQSKSCYQAEIDSACELIDFLRFNVAFGRQVLAEQPVSSPGVWNRMDHRPLEGFVLAITPFNFTAIGANLPMAPALMGNTVVWKPSPTQQLAAHWTMRLFEAAGLPPGVINMVTGNGGAVSDVAVPHPALAGIHFTGSTGTFQALWQRVGNGLKTYRTYPRLVGETGGKDFVLAHPSADPVALEVALVRGAFEYQGQKCSAASRAYVPRSLWEGGLRDGLADRTRAVRYGDVTDLSVFGGAVIDRRAFDGLSGVLQKAAADPGLEVLAGGGASDEVGFFIEPTVLVGEDPAHEVFSQEYFGPVLSVHVYDDWRPRCGSRTDGAVRADRRGVRLGRARGRGGARAAALHGGQLLRQRQAPGAVVGQQPFGGARASGTNDKAARCSTCCAGRRRARSRRRSTRRATTPTRTWASGAGQGPRSTSAGPRPVRLRRVRGGRPGAAGRAADRGARPAARPGPPVRAESPRRPARQEHLPRRAPSGSESLARLVTVLVSRPRRARLRRLGHNPELRGPAHGRSHPRALDLIDASAFLRPSVSHARRPAARGSTGRLLRPSGRLVAGHPVARSLLAFCCAASLSTMCWLFLVSDGFRPL